MSQNPYAQQPGNPPPSSGGGSMLKVIFFILLGVFVLCAGTCAVPGFFFIKFGKEEFDKVISLQGEVQSAAKRDATVMEKLGTPLNFSGSPQSIQIDNTKVSFDMPIEGPNGKGLIIVNATRDGEHWKLTKLQLKMSDGQTHDLDVNAANAAAKDPTNVEIPLPGSEEEMSEVK